MENNFENGQVEISNPTENTVNKNPYEELFSPEEIKTIEEYAAKINVADENILAGYGVAALKKSAELMGAASIGTANRCDSEVFGLTEKLVGLIEDMESGEGEKTGILGIFKTKSGKREAMSEKFEIAEPLAEEVSLALEGDKEKYMADAKVFGDLCELCSGCIKELSMYIAAGKMKLDHERNVTLVKICEYAKNSGESADVIAAADFGEMCTRFGERISSLEQTRACITQALPRIMLIRNNCAAMCEMINEVTTNALNVWRRHAASALGIDKVGSAVKMPGNAFDREFLRTINTEMIDFLGVMIDRYRKVDDDRVRAEADLRAMESELKQRLIAAVKQK